jgi:hypothetical protein
VQCYAPKKEHKILVTQLKHETIQSLGTISNQTRAGTSAGEKKPHAPPCGATASMRHPLAAAADLPKPHLAKETTAEAGAGGPAARRAETEAAATVGHRMHESAICEANSVS